MNVIQKKTKNKQPTKHKNKKTNTRKNAKTKQGGETKTKQTRNNKIIYKKTFSRKKQQQKTVKKHE